MSMLYVKLIGVLLAVLLASPAPANTMAGGTGAGTQTGTGASGAGPVALDDWTAACELILDFEDGSAANICDNDLGNCGVTCDMTNINTITSSGDSVVGSLSGDFEESDNDRCEVETYNEGDDRDPLGLAGISGSWGGWIQLEEAHSNMRILQGGGVNGSFSLNPDAFGSELDDYGCSVSDDSNDLTFVQTGGGIQVVGEWHHVVCVWNDSTDTLLAMADGVDNAITPTIEDATAIGTGDFDDPFTLSVGNIGLEWDGKEDEMFNCPNLILTEAEVCRICACGWEGKKCSQDPTTATDYAECTTNADCTSGAICAADGGEDNCQGTNCCMGQVASTDPGCNGCDLPAANTTDPS